MIDINRTKLSRESAEQFFQKWAQPEAAPVAQTAPMEDDFTRAAIKAGYKTPEELAKIRQWASSQILKDSWYGKTADETYKTIGWHLGGAGIGAAIGGLLGGGRGALAGTLLGTLAFAVMKIFKVGEPEALRFVQDSIATRKLDTLKEALKTEPAKYRQEIAALESSPTTIYRAGMDIARNPESLNPEEKQELFSNTLPRAAEAVAEENREKTYAETFNGLSQVYPDMDKQRVAQIARLKAREAALQSNLNHAKEMGELQRRRAKLIGVGSNLAFANSWTDQIKRYEEALKGSQEILKKVESGELPLKAAENLLISQGAEKDELTPEEIEAEAVEQAESRQRRQSTQEDTPTTTPPPATPPPPPATPPPATPPPATPPPATPPPATPPATPPDSPTAAVSPAPSTSNASGSRLVRVLKAGLEEPINPVAALRAMYGQTKREVGSIVRNNTGIKNFLDMSVNAPEKIDSRRYKANNKQ